ncbi:MAG: 2-iminoacetate synthase ThiH [Verrucomicrobiota bacterium JB023]|nr:2-iminoacetate synthase ThiH [Verrucomicrobiota bacterium JB023]
MSFVETFNQLPEKQSALLKKFSRLLEPCDDRMLEAMARESAAITRRHFGKTIRLFAPLYVSNECVNNCSYCGFSRDNPILRTTLSPEQVLAEAAHLHEQGFRNVLLVAGEHPKFVSEGYLQDIIRRLTKTFPTIGIEVGPMEDHQYAELVLAGAEGLIVYQETYHRETYSQLHTAGPKKKFDWRLECPERAYRGGFRRIGIGALFGLADWRTEALALAAHLEYLHKHCWKAQFSVAFPRMRPYAGNYQYTPDPNRYLTDRQLVQLIAATRICFPTTGIVVSTREPAELRNNLLTLGPTHMSAGSATDPGGYTGAGCEDLHRTERGRRIDIAEEEKTRATEQFTIDDHRSPEEFARHVDQSGLEPVWKDWDEAILGS